MEWNRNLNCNTQTAQLEKASSLNIALHVNVAGFSVTSNRGLLLFDSVSASLRRTNNHSRSLCWSLIVRWTPGGLCIFSRVSAGSLGFCLVPTAATKYVFYFIFTDGHGGGIFRLEKICDCFDLFWSFLFNLYLQLNLLWVPPQGRHHPRTGLLLPAIGQAGSWILREIIFWIRCKVIFSTRASQYFGKGGSESKGLFYMFFFLPVSVWCVRLSQRVKSIDWFLPLVFLMKSCCLLSFHGDRLLHRLQHNLQHIKMFLEHTLTTFLTWNHFNGISVGQGFYL